MRNAAPGDPITGDDEGSANRAGAADNGATEPQGALPDPESCHRPRGDPPGAVQSAGRCTGPGRRQRERRRARLPDEDPRGQEDQCDKREHTSPFGAAAREQWSLPALGMASIAVTFLEPDPTVEWSAERVASVRERLLSLAPPER